MNVGDVVSYYPTEGECGASREPRAAKVLEVSPEGLLLLQISLGPVSGRGPFLRRAHTPLSSRGPQSGMALDKEAYVKSFGALVEEPFEDDRPVQAATPAELERRLAVLTAERDQLRDEVSQLGKRLDEVERKAAFAAKAAKKSEAAASPTTPAEGV